MNILIVDDHSMFRWGVRQYISTLPDFALAGEASDGNEALAFLMTNAVDLVLLDMEMPGLDGSGFLKELSQRETQRPKILVISQTSSAAFYKRLKDFGINGYILKTEGIEEIANALASIKRGEPYFSPGVAKRLWDSMQTPSSSFESLSEREYEVAKLMSQGFSTKSIADALGCASSTIKTHRTNIMRKIKAKNSAEVASWLTKAELNL